MAVYDSQSFTLEDLRAMRKRILEQRAKGVSSWSYNGQSFTYSSPDAMMRVADEITREIRHRMADDLGLQPVDLNGPIITRPLAGS
ncbi:hypothetical protein BXY70_1331 [Roseovarius halotolerans]|uniref:Uncharacterized protein n=1 Tax=Roseovarius halotolerans TaxID=505353 RepID=A0A1X6Y5M6_9RHOB|nr:hypothetical protein [Roseovarius halotolerans]RKT35298.1 hypothetical protein BXY70_1331 [Roseovarius halotolerans]SLN11136.1 hypothetical protein ROH8110_00065 [Roseovarius halotolerans]